MAVGACAIGQLAARSASAASAEEVQTAYIAAATVTKRGRFLVLCIVVNSPNGWERDAPATFV